MSSSARDLYTDVGPRYQEAFIIAPQLQSLRTLLSILPPKSHVLDVCCGTGRPAGEMLTAAGHKFTGVDVTPAMAEKAREQLPGANILISDARTWEPAEQDLPFDCVISYYGFLLHITNDETRAFLPKTFQWLRPGGLFVLGTLNFEGNDVPIKWLGRDVTASNLGTEELRRVLKGIGFEILEEQTGTFTPEKAVEVGLCGKDDVWEEDHIIFICKKPEV